MIGDKSVLFMANHGISTVGATVAVVARNEAKSNDAVAEFRQHGVKAISVVTDVTDKAAVTTLNRLVALGILTGSAFSTGRRTGPKVLI